MGLTKAQNAARMRLTRYQAHASQIVDDGRRGERVRQEYAVFLQGYRWDYFLTSTFREPRKEPYYAIQSVKNELVRHNVARGFLAAEPHQSGDLHIHGIVAGVVPRPVTMPDGGLSPERNLIESPFDVWHGLFKRFGRSKVELANSHEAITMYVSKYVLKQQTRVCDYYELFGNKRTWQGGKL